MSYQESKINIIKDYVNIGKALSYDTKDSTFSKAYSSPFRGTKKYVNSKGLYDKNLNISTKVAQIPKSEIFTSRCANKTINLFEKILYLSEKIDKTIERSELVLKKSSDIDSTISPSLSRKKIKNTNIDALELKEGDPNDNNHRFCHKQCFLDARSIYLENIIKSNNEKENLIKIEETYKNIQKNSELIGKLYSIRKKTGVDMEVLIDDIFTLTKK